MTPRLRSGCFAAVVGLLLLAHGVHVAWVLVVVALMLAVDRAPAAH